MKLTEYVDPGLVVFDIRPGGVSEILSQLIAPLVEDGTLNGADRVLDALLAREKVLSTGIGMGIAVPHAISEAIQLPCLIVGLAPDGVDFHAMDEAPVSVFFVLLSPPDRAGHHIRLLARIARLARHPEFVDALRACESGEQVVDQIEDYERAHVQRLTGGPPGIRLVAEEHMVELLIAVINDVDLIDEVLAGFLEIGITGATVLDSEGMGRVLSHDIPIFAGLQTLISRSRPQNQTLFSVIDDPEKVDQAIALLQDVCGRFDDPATGIAITVPVHRVVGLAAELGTTEG